VNSFSIEIRFVKQYMALYFVCKFNILFTYLTLQYEHNKRILLSGNRYITSIYL